MATPDPSAIPLSVFVSGIEGPALDELRLLIFTTALGFFVVAVLLAGLMVAAGLRR